MQDLDSCLEKIAKWIAIFSRHYGNVYGDGEAHLLNEHWGKYQLTLMGECQLFIDKEKVGFGEDHFECTYKYFFGINQRVQATLLTGTQERLYDQTLRLKHIRKFLPKVPAEAKYYFPEWIWLVLLLIVVVGAVGHWICGLILGVLCAGAITGVILYNQELRFYQKVSKEAFAKLDQLKKQASLFMRMAMRFQYMTLCSVKELIKEYDIKLTPDVIKDAPFLEPSAYSIHRFSIVMCEEYTRTNEHIPNVNPRLGEFRKFMGESYKGVEEVSSHGAIAIMVEIDKSVDSAEKTRKSPILALIVISLSFIIFILRVS